MFLKKAKTNPQSNFYADSLIDKSSFYEVFSACLGKSISIKNSFRSYLGPFQEWHVDFSKKIISFDNKRFPVQLIGNESDSSRSWMWGWNNINHLSSSVLQLSNEIKDIGIAWNNDALTTPVFETNSLFNGESMAIVSCALSRQNYCWFSGKHSNGTIHLGIAQLPPAVFAPVDLGTFASTAASCLENHSVDHKIFIESYLRWNAVRYEWVNNLEIIAYFPQSLHISFEVIDGFMRVSNLYTD